MDIASSRIHEYMPAPINRFSDAEAWEEESPRGQPVYERAASVAALLRLLGDPNSAEASHPAGRWRAVGHAVVSGDGAAPADCESPLGQALVVAPGPDSPQRQERVLLTRPGRGCGRRVAVGRTRAAPLGPRRIANSGVPLGCRARFRRPAAVAVLRRQPYVAPSAACPPPRRRHRASLDRGVGAAWVLRCGTWHDVLALRVKNDLERLL